MFILYGCLVALAFAALDAFLLCPKPKTKYRLFVLFSDTVLGVLGSLVFMRYVLHTENVFFASLHGPKYPLKFMLLCAAASVCIVVFRAFWNGVLRVEAMPDRKKAGDWTVRVISVLLFALGVAAFTGTIWGKETFGDLTPDQMIINLTSPTEGTSGEIIATVLEGPVLITAFLTALFCLVVLPPNGLVFTNAKKTVCLLSAFAKRILCLCLAVLTFAGGIYFGTVKFQIQKMFSAYMVQSTYIEEHFADPKTTPMKFPEKKRNLIHIYLESMENTYFSKELGGVSPDNLMPDLAALSKEGYSFSNRESGFGGFQYSVGANWSVASMVNMSTGLPMKVPANPNDYGKENNFLPGATALGEILQQQGYSRTLMFGAEAAFGGLDFYYQSHGDFRILDLKGVQKEGWLPEDYYVWWGYEDTKLYEFAKRELTRLSESEQPFYFVMETADTHFPNGYLDQRAPTPYESQYANVIRFSQEETVDFIRWIQDQPFYENTTVVLIGDHLSMDKVFFSDYVDVSNYQRTCFNLILNPAENVRDIPTQRMFNRDWAAFDMFPTLLSSIGVEIEGDRLGIGTDLFSDRQTLFEEDGVDFVNSELENKSEFYNKNILVKNTQTEA